MSQLLDRPYTQAQMTYDLRRLRLKGLVLRIPHTNTYVPTTDGIRAAVIYTKLDHRLLHPLLAAHLTRHPEPRQALNTIDNAVTSYITNARLAIAA